MKLMTAAAVIGGVMLAPSAFAQEAKPFYWWAGYGKLAFEDDLGVTARLGAVQGKLGYRATPYLGVEAEASFGVAEDEIIVLGLSADAGLDRAWGVFGVVFLPLGSEFELFGRAGIAAADLKVTYQGSDATGSDDGVGYGGGLIWNVGPLDVRAEYTLYDFDGESDAYTVSIGGKF